MKEENVHTEEVVFFGGVDSDTAWSYLKKGDFIYALNIINNSSGKGNKGVVEFPNGTLQIPFTLPAGVNKCIGVAEDTENNRFVFFNWNSEGRHGIYRFEATNKTVRTLLVNLDQTNSVDILKFNKDFLILHADVLRSNLLYWVDGLNNARKTNMDKLLDKSSTGYGIVILQSFVDAYKQTSSYPPTVSYFSDTTKPFNRIYGQLRRFAVRYIYDDGEKSNWSDYSAIALPDKEPFNGFNTIPTNNNCLQITTETGNSLVVRIEIAMQSTTGEPNNEGVIDWQLVATLDKKRLGIVDNSFYTYNFYNDSVYPVTSYEKIIRPYNYLPKSPMCQTAAKNKLVYANFPEGFENVSVDVDASVNYEDMFIESSVENKLNKPELVIQRIGTKRLGTGDTFVRLDGSSYSISLWDENESISAFEVKVGNDVKEGNKFSLFFNVKTDKQTRYISFEYTANKTDTAVNVARGLINKIVNNWAYGFVPGKGASGLPNYYIHDLDIDGSNNVTFRFLLNSWHNDGYHIGSAAQPNPVQYNVLKDTGESKRNIKLGSSVKYGIIYEDADGRKSLTYTDPSLIVGIKTINELIKVDGKTKFQTPIVNLTINHRPPIWARYYQIVRSNDLIYQDYIQLLVQKAVEVQSTNNTYFTDLVIGSLFTYNKIYSNSNLSYNFSKGDRLRLIKRTDVDTYYDFFETEILQYLPIVTETQKSNITTNGSNTVTVQASSADNIGRFIVIDGIEREIVGVGNSTQYTLNAPIGDATAKTYLSWDLVDRRGVLRIRKPSVQIDDFSIVEIFTPAKGDDQIVNKQFYEFQKKFDIINYGTVNAYHDGNVQNQDATNPAVVKITEGTAYVRNRELPKTNVYPGAQIAISLIEDPRFSDFYPSLINDNGRPNVEDTGVGEVQFIDRMRFSNNSIDETKLNGLGDFDNLDREDYTDEFGAIVRTVFYNNNILTFKKLRTAYVPLDGRITIDDAGSRLRVGSVNFLNPMQYYSWEGGIGDNPEAFCSEGTHRYIVSANSGVALRLGFNGEEPISKTFHFDKEIREILEKATVNKAKIFIGFNRKLSLLCITIEGYKEFIYFNGFNGWKVTKDTVLPTDTIQIISAPNHGSVVINSENKIDYTANTDYVGGDGFTYIVFHNGQWTDPEHVCFDIVEQLNRQTAWRGKASSITCEINPFGQTGNVIYGTLEQYYLDDNTPTGTEKDNLPSDADYIAPVQDLSVCARTYVPKWIVDESESYCEKTPPPTVRHVWGRLEYDQIEWKNNSGGGNQGNYCNLNLKLYEGTDAITPPLPTTSTTLDSPLGVTIMLNENWNTYSHTIANGITSSYTNNSITTAGYKRDGKVKIDDGGSNYWRWYLNNASVEHQMMFLKTITQGSPSVNTGNLINPKQKKVWSGSDEFPMDDNDDLCSESGLPQSQRDTPTSDPNYIVEDHDACPVGSSGGGGGGGDEGDGTCYNLVIANSSLNNGSDDLYITIKRPGGELQTQHYNAYLSFLEPTPGYTGIYFCSETYPQFRYGFDGPALTIEDATVTTGGSCTTDSECDNG